MLETETRNYSLQELPIPEQYQRLNDLAQASFSLLQTHQLPNGLIPATLGRYDDEYFKDSVWTKDHVRGARFALNPNIDEHLPEIATAAQGLYLSSIRSILQLQVQSDQIERFKVRPGPPDEHGYSTIDDRDVPAIKFHSNGHVLDWGHNQPDNWGVLLLEAGKGIELGLPVLAPFEDEILSIGDVLQRITSYVANLKIERLNCRSIWEHNVCWSSYSTRIIVLAGLRQITKVRKHLEQDSKKRGYLPSINKREIQQAVKNLKGKVRERFPADYTDLNHPGRADLALLVVLNDVPLSEADRRKILTTIKQEELENHYGFFRYFSDPWQRDNQGNSTEAIWTLGKPAMAKYYFQEAIFSYQQNEPLTGNRNLNRGLERMSVLLELRDKYGYIPELLYYKDGRYFPNNNDLAWTRSYIIEACAAGMAALRMRSNYHKETTLK